MAEPLIWHVRNEATGIVHREALGNVPRKFHTWRGVGYTWCGWFFEDKDIMIFRERSDMAATDRLCNRCFPEGG